MSTAAEEETSKVVPLIYESARAIREGRALPEVRYPRYIAPPIDAPRYLWLAAHMWHRWSDELIDQWIGDDLRREAAENFPPPMDRVWLSWLGDVLHDKLFRGNSNYLAVLSLQCALSEDNAKGIARELSVVLDRAGERFPKPARLEAAWRGMRAINDSWRKGKPKDNPIAYLRAYVARDAKTTAYRYGDERPCDPTRVAGHERLSAELLDNPTGYLETPPAYRDGSGRGNFQDQPGVGKMRAKVVSRAHDNQKRITPPSLEALDKMANPSPEVIMLVDEKGKDSQRILKMISECLHPGETELLELIQCEEIPAAEAERRRGMPAGTYRNLVKRIRRQFPKRPN